ncbi:hypothetical protein [Streptomyces galbus]|uniref:Uncharacterized protein n=1 Tax=Streptomyces galbus TaxID=33898 RepID=A0A4U5WZG1_STRGB|nr:hypothetical protein [Streptomyces galbus]TKT08045.1 hypothetical protein E4U92_18700 [Streptomyces galbus]GHD42399.1 hypothetical protein GCM10010335_45280 [Streptomyces galbus]
MSDLINFVIEKHGGLKLWEEASRVSATVHVRGGFWAYKGQPDLLGVEEVTADLRRRHIEMSPFGEGQSLSFDAEDDRVVITRTDGSVVEELDRPRASMAGFAGDTQWTAAQTGYFISYATRMYLLEPYLFTLPGITTREVEPWSEAGETWRRLEVTFPDSFLPTHNSVQTYYFDAETGLQRRMDYSPDVNGNPPVAHYTSEHQNFGGLIVPTRRRVLLRRDDNTAIHEAAAILLDVTDVRLER